MPNSTFTCVGNKIRKRVLTNFCNQSQNLFFQTLHYYLGIRYSDIFLPVWSFDRIISVYPISHLDAIYDTMDLYICQVIDQQSDRNSGETHFSSALCNASMNFPVAILCEWKRTSSLFTCYALYVENKDHSFVMKVNLFKSHHNMSLLI